MSYPGAVSSGTYCKPDMTAILDAGAPTRRPTVSLLDVRQLALNAGWLLAARGVSGVAQFVTLALVARHLGPLSYGHWGFALAFTAVFAVLADFGLSTIAVRDLAQTPSPRSYVGSIGALKVGLNVVVFLLVAATAPLTGQSEETQALIYLLGAQAVIATSTLLISAVFRAAERMAFEAWIMIGQSLVSVGIVTLLIREDASAPALAAGYLAAGGCGFLASVIVLLRWFDVSWEVDVSRVKSIASETWPLGVGMLMTSVYYFFDRVFMGALGQDRQLGLYTAAYAPVLALSSLVINVVRVAFLPALSRADGVGDASLLRFYGRVSFVLAGVTALGGVLLAGTIVGVMYGGAYDGAARSLQVLSVAAAFMFTSSFYGSILLTSGRQRRYLVGVTAGAIVNVAANLPLVPLFSLEGAAVATVLSEAAVTAFMAWSAAEVLSLRNLGFFLRSAAMVAIGFGLALGLASLVVPA